MKYGISQQSENNIVSLFLPPLHTQSTTEVWSEASVLSKQHGMFVYVILSVLLGVIQLRTVILKETGVFKAHYELCQHAAQ